MPLPEIETTEQVEAQGLLLITIAIQEPTVLTALRHLQEVVEVIIEVALHHPEAIRRVEEVTTVLPVGLALEVTVVAVLQEAAGPVAPTEAQEAALEAQV